MPKSQNIITIPKAFRNITNLPYWSVLNQIPGRDLALFGCLTWKYEIKNNERKIMDEVEEHIASIGEKHFVPLERLLYVYRIEGGRRSYEFASDHSIVNKIHAHYVLWKERIVTNSERPYTKKEAAALLKKQWRYGITDIQPYDGRRNGLKYILKAPLGPQSADFIDISVMSDELFKRLRKLECKQVVA